MRPPVIGAPEVGVPYVEPADIVPPPLFRMPMTAPVAMGVSVAGAAVDDPLVADSRNNGVFPCITYGGQNPIYASFGAITGLSGDIANLSNEVANLSAYVYNNPSTASNWSTFPAVSTINASGNVITNVSSLQIDAQILTANASSLFLNGVAVATISNISNVSDWALYPALANVNLSNFALQNVSGLQLDGQAISSDGLFVLVNGSNGVERWAQFPAAFNVDMSGHDIINVDQIDASGVSCVDSYINNLYVYTPDNMSSAVVTSTNSGATLLLNSVPLLTSADISANVGLWSTFPAVSDVNMSGHNILGNGDLGISANNISMSALSNIYLNQTATTQSINMTGNITQCNAGAGSNFFQSEVQVGVNGVLPTDNLGSVAIYGGNLPPLLSSLYVEGGTTLDGGGTVHGITIGTLPVAGINTQRIDVLPAGIEMTTPTFITMNGLGAANIAMGGAVAIAAGSYVALEHAAGLGANGIFVQNAADDSNCKMIFTNGGTLYNATEVQASNIVNPLGVRFYNGVYNPSGSSIIVPAVYGRAIVDGSGSSYLANLTGGDLPAVKNTNSIFIGNLTNLSTGGATSTIAIGDTDGMTGQGANSIAIGKEAGSNTQGANSIAIGWEAGQENQGSNSVAVGRDAGFDTQGTACVAIGTSAGLSNQGN